MTLTGAQRGHIYLDTRGSRLRRPAREKLGRRPVRKSRSASFGAIAAVRS